MSKISKYDEFINEGLILEANIKYEKDFLNLIKDINSPIKDSIISLQDKDVDVNQNYLDIVVDKEDTVSFFQDDRVEKVKYTMASNDYSTYNQICALYDLPPFDSSYNNMVDYNTRMSKDRTVEVVKKLTMDDKGSEYFSYLLKGDDPSPAIVKLEINGKDVYTLTNFIRKDLSAMKRGEIKIGRFVRTLLKKADVEFKDKEIEDFVTKYKSLMKIKIESFSRFELVNGEDIRNWYLEDNYESSAGTLGGSCMRYAKCQRFLGIYTGNKEKVSMIILKSDKDDSKISGRAILWTVDDGRKVMDRVYTNNHADIEFFIQYANLNNYLYKYTQSYEPMPFVLNDVKLSNQESSCVITLDTSWDSYPYMDTFKYMSDGELTNDYSRNYESELTDTNGGNGSCDSCGGSGSTECDECRNGTVECYECDGQGDTRCNQCDGDGAEECSDCEGDGNIECGECDGDGCESCDDNGSISCETCSGNGTVDCSDEDCNDGRVPCEECGGDGERTCGYCDGDGTVECYNCN